MENHRCRVGSIQGEGKAFSMFFLTSVPFLTLQMFEAISKKMWNTRYRIRNMTCTNLYLIFTDGIYIVNTAEVCYDCIIQCSARPWHVYTVFCRITRSSAHIRVSPMKTTSEPEACSTVLSQS